VALAACGDVCGDHGERRRRRRRAPARVGGHRRRGAKERWAPPPRWRGWVGTAVVAAVKKKCGASLGRPWQRVGTWRRRPATVAGTECRPHGSGATAAEVPARWRRSHCAAGTLAMFWDAYEPPRVGQCPGRGNCCWHRCHTTAHWRVTAAGVVAGALQCAAAISSTPGALLSGALARSLSPHSASDRRRGFLTVRRRQSKRSARHTCSCGRSPPSRQRQ